MPYCGICDLGFISDEALEGHRSDKKHLSRSEEYQRRVLEAAHSVHVTGFSRNISYEHLNGYFENFGKVQDVTYIDHNNSRWPFAFVKFENLLVASQVLRYKHHCLNGHFLRVQPKRLKFRNPNRLEASNLNSADADDPNKVGGQIQVGYQNKYHKKDVKYLMQDSNEMFSSLVEKLQTKNTIAEQMELLYEELKLTDDDLKQRMEFCELLHSVLEPYFPGCSVVLFGSSVNGFGVKGCDIDIFLDLNHLMLQESPPTESSNSTLKPMTQRDAMPVQMKEFLQFTPYQRIKYLLKILARNLHTNYCDFFPVPSTRCPIVRFSHKISRITCDFSIQNKMVLCNSHLMKFLSEYDNRLQPFVFAIRLWAKRKKLASVGGTHFSSYSLTLMAIFFLQNTKPAVLPSIQEVMDSCTKEEETAIDGFSCSFPQRPAHTVLPPNSNEEDLGDLLEKFFDFFQHLDYETTVISPQTGNLLSRSEINSSEQMKSFKMGPICIQDPYLLEHNTSGNVTDKIRMDFIRELSVAQNKLSQMPTDGHLRGLAHILMRDESPAEKANTCKLKSKPHNLPYSLYLPINVSCLDKEMGESVRKFSNTHLLWCKILCSFLQEVLEEVLLIECRTEKVDLDLVELLKTAETQVEDGDSDGKTKYMEDKEALDIIANANDNGNFLINPAQIFNKRQSDENISGEVKRTCLKDEGISCTDGVNWKDTVPEHLKNNNAPKQSVISCNQCNSNEKIAHLNHVCNIEENEMLETSEMSSLQEMTSLDEVAAPDAEKKCCENEKQQPCLLQLMCTVQHNSWCNRKKVRQKLLPQWKGSEFEMEKKISEHIVAVNHGIISEPSLATFRFKVTPDENSSACVHINPIMSASKEVTVFYQFLSPFINRMVSSHFIKWCIVTSPQRLDSSELRMNISTSKMKDKP